MVNEIIAFSGGKDSWAVLMLNKGLLNNIAVVWVNTGKNYPLLLESIEKARNMCPNFVEILVDRDGQNSWNGLPSDVVPINNTVWGKETSGNTGEKIQSYMQCCHENISQPIFDYAKRMGIKFIQFGQRLDEKYKNPKRDGCVVDGIVRLHPIELWSKLEVIQFLKKEGVELENFRFEHSSMDCYDCTAFFRDTEDLREYRAQTCPDLQKEYVVRWESLKKELNESLDIYR